MATAASTAYGGADHDDGHHAVNQGIQLGPRPFYLVDGMDQGPLKNRLSQCKDGLFSRTDFSIGRRPGYPASYASLDRKPLRSGDQIAPA